MIGTERTLGKRAHRSVGRDRHDSLPCLGRALDAVAAEEEGDDSAIGQTRHVQSLQIADHAGQRHRDHCARHAPAFERVAIGEV